MKNYREIVAGMYARRCFKQCIGTTAYIQFTENVDRPMGCRRSFGYIVNNIQRDIGDILMRAFCWRNTEQGHQYWSELHLQWSKFANDTDICRKLSHILKNTKWK